MWVNNIAPSKLNNLNNNPNNKTNLTIEDLIMKEIKIMNTHNYIMITWMINLKALLLKIKDLTKAMTNHILPLEDNSIHNNKLKTLKIT